MTDAHPSRPEGGGRHRRRSPGPGSPAAADRTRHGAASRRPASALAGVLLGLALCCAALPPPVRGATGFRAERPIEALSSWWGGAVAAKVRSGAPPGVLVAWNETAGVAYSASFDGGCTFCPTLVLPYTEYVTSIEALELPGGEPLVLIVIGSGPTILRGPGTSWTCAGMPGPADFQAVPVTIPAGAFAPFGLSAAYPQEPGSSPHLHLSYINWAGPLNAHVSVDLDSDLVFAEPGEPYDINLSRNTPAEPSTVWVMPDGMGSTQSDTGAVAVFTGQSSPATLLLLRSADSGRNWSADGTPPPLPPTGPPLEAVSLPGSGCFWTVGAASAASGEGRWLGAVCSDASGDIAYQSGPTTTAPGWTEPDIEFVDWSAVPLTTGAGAGIGFARGPSPSVGDLHIFWRAPAPHGTEEIWFQTRPLAAPSKPSGSQGGAFLTGLDPPRTTLVYPEWSPVYGPAAVISDSGRVWVFWRHQDGAIRYTLSDAVPAALAGLAAGPDPGCPPRIALQWDPPADCDLRTVRLSWGLQAGGPYDFTLDLPPVPGHILDGLLGGADYHILVQTLDEAGNLWPPGTDPSGNSPENLAAELSATTPACPCAAGAWIAGPPPAEVCSGEPVLLDSAGSFVQGCAEPLGIEWSEGGGPPFSTAPSVQVAPLSDADYALRVICPSQPGCEASASHDVRVHPLPVADAGGPYAECEWGSGITYVMLDGRASAADPSTAIGKYGYEWTTSEGMFTQDEDTARPQLTLRMTGIAREVSLGLQVRDLRGCMDTDETILTLVPRGTAPPPVPGPLLLSRDPALPGVIRFRWEDLPGEPIQKYQVLRLAGSVPPPTPARFAAEGALAGESPSGATGVDSPEIGAPSPGATFYAVRAVSPCEDVGSTCDPAVPPCP